MAFLKVENITKSFGKTEVLKGIDFELNKGEILAIIGSSGSGKTTLLRCLNFLEKADTGKLSVGDEILFDSDNKTRMGENELRKKRLHFGLVFQNFNLFPHYSVLKNISLAPYLYGKETKTLFKNPNNNSSIKNLYLDFTNKKQQQKKVIQKAKSDFEKETVKSNNNFSLKNYKKQKEKKTDFYAKYENPFSTDYEKLFLTNRPNFLKFVMQETNSRAKTQNEYSYELLKTVGLSDKAKSYPCELSGGQQQRVAIARALALNPDILCFDEPTSALDPELTGEVLKVIRDLKSTDRTMIIVTHEMEFAKNVADKIIFMADGIIAEEGTPEQVFGNPKNEKTINFLQNSLENI